VFFRLPPAHRYAIFPPRARPREGPTRAPFQIAYLDRERFLPILLPNQEVA
jgi:hypothetical protein